MIGKCSTYYALKACYPAYGYESVMIGMFNIYALSSLLTLQCGLLNGVDRDVTFNGAGGGAEGHSAAHTHMVMYDYCHNIGFSIPSCFGRTNIDDGQAYWEFRSSAAILRRRLWSAHDMCFIHLRCSHGSTHEALYT